MSLRIKHEFKDIVDISDHENSYHSDILVPIFIRAIYDVGHNTKT